ncbi:MAG: hypothetical protein HQM14_17115 [SAR324 cluster bacterium]|nr:hypothetical protein [SAR324 cluster bacterium]
MQKLFIYFHWFFIFLILCTSLKTVFAKDLTNIQIPHYGVIEQLRTSFYKLRFLESRSTIQSMIDQTETPVRETYQTIFRYMELTSLLGRDDQGKFDLFDQQADEAVQQLEKRTKTEPNNPVWQIYLGLVYGLKAGVAMSYRQSYWQAYYQGMKGVKIFEEIQRNYPKFYDTSLSAGILQIMIAQSSWIIRTFAPLFVPSGSLEEGMKHLEIVMKKGKYVREEAELFCLFFTWGKVPQEIRAESLRKLAVILNKYPENIQLYYFIAKGYWALKQYSRANQYAIKGLQQLHQQNSLFINQNQRSLQAFLLRIQYRYLALNQQWRQLLNQTKHTSDFSGVSQIYHAYALKKLKRRQEAIDLAHSALADMKKTELSMPFFISPYMLSIEGALKRLINQRILND